MLKIQTDLPCILLLMMLLAGLSFMDLNDRYIQPSHRRIIFIIAALDFSLIMQNLASYYLEVEVFRPLLRTVVSIYGYTVRPLLLIMFFYLVNPKLKYRPAWCIFGVNTVINLTALFSHLCFWIDERNHFQRGPLGYTCHNVSIIFLAYFVYLTVKEYWRVQKWLVAIPIFNVLLIIGSIILDYKIVGHEYPVTYLTAAVICGSVFFYIWLHLLLVREHEEALMAQQRIQIMMTQIQPHFLFNTISTIKVLCLQQPEKAADITDKFGMYLRQNFDSLGQTGLIPFRKELEHTRLYSDIEMVRFDSIRVEYDIEDSQFSMPSLTLQPMVENAIRHGVRVCEEGIVRVVTRLKDGYHEIIIQDNGCGFDPEKINEDDGAHIGIRNVRERLQSMCGGSLTVDSVIGEGTTVTIRIPLESPEKRDGDKTVIAITKS